MVPSDLPHFPAVFKTALLFIHHAKGGCSYFLTCPGYTDPSSSALMTCLLSASSRWSASSWLLWSLYFVLLSCLSVGQVWIRACQKAGLGICLPVSESVCVNVSAHACPLTKDLTLSFIEPHRKHHMGEGMGCFTELLSRVYKGLSPWPQLTQQTVLQTSSLVKQHLYIVVNVRVYTHFIRLLPISIFAVFRKWLL